MNGGALLYKLVDVVVVVVDDVEFGEKRSTRWRVVDNRLYKTVLDRTGSWRNRSLRGAGGGYLALM